MTRKLLKIGIPKIYGFMARRAEKMVLLYQRHRKEIFVLLYTYGDGHGGAQSKLEVGARFGGRFYPSRCDLSPDANHFVYFVMGSHQKGFKEKHYCWTAMSRPPALTALFLLPHDDTWGGGGKFLNEHTLAIEGGMYNTKEELERLHGHNVEGVHIRVHSNWVECRNPTGLPVSVLDCWASANRIKRMVSDEIGISMKHAKRSTLVLRRRRDWLERGEFSGRAYVVCDRLGHKLLPVELMDRVTWADFNHHGQLVMGVGHELHIYDKPGRGMAARPDQVIDLEQAIAAG